MNSTLCTGLQARPQRAISSPCSWHFQKCLSFVYHYKKREYPNMEAIMVQPPGLIGRKKWTQENLDSPKMTKQAHDSVLCSVYPGNSADIALCLVN